MSDSDGDSVDSVLDVYRSLSFHVLVFVFAAVNWVKEEVRDL